MAGGRGDTLPVNIILFVLSLSVHHIKKTENVYTVKEEIFIVHILSFKSPFSNICEKICENICENIFHQRTGSRVIFETQIFISMFMTFLVPKI